MLTYITPKTYGKWELKVIINEKIWRQEAASFSQTQLIKQLANGLSWSTFNKGPLG